MDIHAGTFGCLQVRRLPVFNSINLFECRQPVGIYFRYFQLVHGTAWNLFTCYPHYFH
jgi:hypothetical protein